MCGELGGLCDSSELGTRLASVTYQSPEFYSRVQSTMFQQLLEEVRAQVHLARIFFQEPPSSRYFLYPILIPISPPRLFAIRRHGKRTPRTSRNSS